MRVSTAWVQWRRNGGLVLVMLFLSFLLAGMGVGRAEQGRELPIKLVYATFDPLVDGEPAVPAALADPQSAHRLLQLAGPPRQQWIADLEALGVRFYDYLPTYTYVVGVDPLAFAAVDGHPAVRWLGPLHPAYKLSPTIAGSRLVVSLFPDAPAGQVATLVAATGATVLETDDAASLLLVEAGSDLLPALARLDEVRWIQNAAPIQEFNDDARWVSQSGVQDLTPLYERGLTGAGQVGGVADSGLAVYPYAAAGDPLYNPVPSCFVADEAGGVPRLPGADHRKVLAYEIPPGADGDRYDSSGHGTHVVASVAGDRPPYGQPSVADGQAYGARVFFQDIGTGIGFPQNPVVSVNPPSDYGVLFGQAYDPDGDGVYQASLEPRTHSNSWGSTDPIYSVESAQTDAFMWQHPDFLILFAAGNQGPAPATIGYPATAKNVVTVGATENGLADPNSMGYFSSHGTPGGRLKPTLSAPGDRITSALQGVPCATVEKSGTSMATPTVHGLALLMRQYLWDGYYPGGAPNPADRHHPSAALLKALLMNSARPMDGAHSDNGTGGAWPSRGQGWGRVTADDALYFQGDQRALWLHDEVALDGSAGFTAAGQTRTFTLTVGTGRPFAPQPLKLTLAWTDYPATPLSGELVNDLHLRVVDPAGNIHLGNDPASNDFRGLGELPLLAPDTVNPWEMVYLEQPLPGVYTITVSAGSLGSPALDPQRAQGYALVATGDLRQQRGRAGFEFPVYDPRPETTARVRLADVDLNGDPLQVEKTWVSASVRGRRSQRHVRLWETGPDTGVFSGTLVLSTVSGSSGSLLIAPADTVELVYRDADDGHGEQQTVVDHVTVGALPLNFAPPPYLEPVSAAADGQPRLRWQPPAETARLAGYEVQETTVYGRPLADDAEGDINALWTTGSGWSQDGQYRQSGSSSYWSGRGDTGVSIDSALTLRQPLTFPAGATAAELSFYSRYYNDLNDNGHVEISADGGQNWLRLRRLYADPRVVPPDDRLRPHQLDLTPWLGQALLLRFRYDNGVVSFAPDSPGWWLDDIRLSAGAWQTVGTRAPGSTTLGLSGREPGRYYYRVRALYTDGSAGSWSDVQTLLVADPS